MWDIVNYGINNDSIKEIAITGGEPFLNENLVFDIIHAVHLSGKRVTCITNGFWGASYEIAREKIQTLYQLGLDALSISYDEFHEEFIPIERIKNILLAVVQIPIRLFFNMSVTKVKTSQRILSELNDYLLGVPITRFSVASIGNAKKLDKNTFYYKLDIEGSMMCSEPGSGMVIHHDGYVYPCCSPLVFDTILRVGSIKEFTIDELSKKFHKNLILFIIKKEGLKWFVDKCRNKDYNIFKEKYISTCELCGQLFSDNQVIEMIHDDIKEYYENKHIL